MDNHLTFSFEGSLTSSRGSIPLDGGPRKARRLGESCDVIERQEGGGTGSLQASGSIRLVRTGCILLAFMAHGLYAGVSTTSSVDFQELYDTAIDKVTVAMGMNLLGQMLGSLLAGPAIRCFRHVANVVMGVFTLLEGLTFVFVPMSSSIFFGGVMMGVRGIIHGINFPICNTVLLLDWGVKAPTAVNAVHLGYSVGYFLAPIITAQFLSPDRFPTGNTSAINFTDSLAYETSPYLNITHALPLGSNSESRLIIPFMICGSVGMLAGLTFLVLVFIGKRSGTDRTTLADALVPSHETRAGLSGPARRTRIILLIMLFMVYLTLPFKESIVPVFIFYIGVESPLHMSKTRAAILNAAGGACWVVGRLMATVLTKRLRIHVLMYGVLVISLILGIFLSIFGLDSERNLWILSCIFQVFCSPTNACIMTWVDRYISIDGVMMSVIEFSSGVGGFLILVIGGFILENLGYASVFYVAAIFSLEGLLLILVLQVILHKLGDRFHRTEIIVTANEEATEKSPLLK